MKSPFRRLLSTTYSLQPQQGFTLIETIVTVVIISTLAALLTLAYPSARDNQTLLLAEQEIQSRLHDAQTRAVNETRDALCEDAFAATALEERRRCSDAGVYLRDRTLIVFADTSGDLTFTLGSDYLIYQTELPPSVTVSGNQNYVFIALPPTVKLFSDSLEVTTANPGRFQLRQGSTLDEFEVTSFGNLNKVR